MSRKYPLVQNRAPPASPHSYPLRQTLAGVGAIGGAWDCSGDNGVCVDRVDGTTRAPFHHMFVCRMFAGDARNMLEYCRRLLTGLAAPDIPYHEAHDAGPPAPEAHATGRKRSRTETPDPAFAAPGKRQKRGDSAPGFALAVTPNNKSPSTAAASPVPSLMPDTPPGGQPCGEQEVRCGAPRPGPLCPGRHVSGWGLPQRLGKCAGGRSRVCALVRVFELFAKPLEDGIVNQ